MKLQAKVQQPTFDELVWPQPTTRRQSLEVERMSSEPSAADNFECSNWSLAAIWILNGVLLTAIGIAAWYITTWFIL